MGILITTQTLKQGLLFFWSLWLTVVTASNLFSLLKSLGLLPEGWKFTSGNYQAVQEALARYQAPGPLTDWLFTGVILWQALAAVLFWIAFWGFPETGQGQTTTAFAVLLALFAIFIIADEILRKYESERDHLQIIITLLVTFLVIVLLP